MAVVLTVEFHLVRIFELTRVAIRGGERHQDTIARLHRTTLEINVAVDDSSHGHRGIDAQQLFDSGRPQRWIVAKLLTMFGMLSKVSQRRANCRPRGIHPRHEHQVADAEDVGVRNFLTLHFGLNEFADEVAFARIFPAIGKLFREE